jgi:hypothetical protein
MVASGPFSLVITSGLYSFNSAMSSTDKPAHRDTSFAIGAPSWLRKAFAETDLPLRIAGGKTSLHAVQPAG